MDYEKLIQKYPHVSREEIEEIRETNDYEGLCDSTVESTISTLHNLREYERINGKESVLVGPLIQLLSVKFVPNSLQDTLPISGRISTEFNNNSRKITVHDFEVLGLDDNGFLKVANPQSSSWPFSSCMPFEHTRFVVDLATGGKALVKTYISCECEDNATEFEQINHKNVHTEVGDFTLHYITIPFAIYARVKVTFQSKNHSFLDVKGKIIAHYANSCNSTLFDKESDGSFERVDFGEPEYDVDMNLPRCWIALPVYSPIILDVNLMEFGSGLELVKEVLEFGVGNKYFSYKNYIVGDFLIEVGVEWISPMPQGNQYEERATMSDDESSGEDMCVQGTSEHNSDDERMIESDAPEASSNLIGPWLRVHPRRPFPTSLVEIYSIYVGRNKLKALQLYGSVEISSLGNSYYCFNKGASNAFSLLEGARNLPLLDGSLVYDDSDSFKIKINLKDVEGSLCIRGQLIWDDRTLEFGTQWFNKPLCSFFEGQNGFAVVSYSFFPQAVKANLMVLCAPKEKTGSERFEVLPRVYGIITAQHDYFDYTSRYNKDYFRVTLFERNAESAIQTSADGVITLPRSIIVVPLDSALVLGLNLSMSVGDNQVSFKSSVNLKVGTSNFSVESESKDYLIHFDVKWLD